MELKENNKSISLKYHSLSWLEKITIGISIWFLFYPHPYELLVGILIFIPILGLFLNSFDKKSIESLVEIEFKSDGTSYDVVDFIDFAAIVLVLRCFLDFEIDNFKALIIPGFITFVFMVIFLLISHKSVISKNK